MDGRDGRDRRDERDESVFWIPTTFWLVEQDIHHEFYLASAKGETQGLSNVFLEASQW